MNKETTWVVHPQNLQEKAIKILFNRFDKPFKASMESLLKELKDPKDVSIILEYEGVSLLREASYRCYIQEIIDIFEIYKRYGLNPSGYILDTSAEAALYSYKTDKSIILTLQKLHEFSENTVNHIKEYFLLFMNSKDSLRELCPSMQDTLNMDHTSFQVLINNTLCMITDGQNDTIPSAVIDRLHLTCDYNVDNDEYTRYIDSLKS